jgi:hypothetical protein
LIKSAQSWGMPPHPPPRSKVRLGEYDDVAAVRLDGGRPHAPCHETLEVGMHGAVSLGHDVLGFDFQLLKHEPSALAGSSRAGIASVTSFRAQPRRSSQSDGLGGSIMSKTKRRTTAKANAKPRPIATSNPKLPIAGSWCT